MAVLKSQNGWGAFASSKWKLDNSPVPGTDVKLVPGVRSGDVATVLFDLAAWFHVNIEPLKNPGCWGHAFRLVRAGLSMSNHASGTAIDLNAPKHPLGKRNTFTATQTARIRAKLRDYDGVIRWGGDYNSRPDEMHFEIVGSAAQVARVAKKIKAKVPEPRYPNEVGRAPDFPLAETAYFGPKGGPDWSVSGYYTNTENQSRQHLKRFQQALQDLWKSGITDDGLYGEQTRAIVTAFQKHTGLPAHGLIDARTWAMAWHVKL